jgi:hypothetical protein
VVVAEDPPIAGEGLLLEVAGAVGVAQLLEDLGEVAQRSQSGGVVVSSNKPLDSQNPFIHGQGLLILAGGATRQQIRDRDGSSTSSNSSSQRR